jgi:uncharacterized membrane protein YgaE (UPF0421/DUF939 family)
VAGAGAFRTDGPGGSGFAAGGAVVPAAGKLLGAAFAISSQRFIGTLLGALVGAVAAAYFGPHALVFGICVFLLGLLCALTRSGPAAYRFGGVALAIVILTPRSSPAWMVAFHRFAEVSIGIGVALLLAVVWPDREAIPSR